MLTDGQKAELYKWWAVFRRGKSLVEIRIIDGKKIWSGYYTNIDNLIRDVEQHMDANIYFTINLLDDSTYGRPQHECLKLSPKNTTTDSEIIGRVFVFIDIDCKKIANVNSTDSEKAYAYKKAGEIYKFLLNNGFSDMVVVDSGNGYHIYIPCKMDTSKESNELVERFTHAVALLFSDEKVDVDLKVANLARIAKLPGSFSRKGSALSVDRPQRPCRILYVPDEIETTDSAYFRHIAEIYPTEIEKPSFANNFNAGKFDLDEFLRKHGIEVTEIENVAGGKKYILKHCVFDESHSGKDACIFVSSTGAIGYHCFHSHCAHYTWQDVRLKYEPDAYSKKTVAEFMHKQRYYGNFYREPFVPKPESEELGKKWLAPTEIERMDISTLCSTNTGYPELDKAMWGLFMGDVTIITGESGQGKSVWLNNVCANMVERNVNVGIWSGELQGWKLWNWLYCTFAGKSYTKKRIGYENWYYAPSHVCDAIDAWIGRRLLTYNNKYGNNFAQLFNDIKEAVDSDNIQVVVVDNLAALDLSEYEGKDLEKQTKFVTDLKNFAQTKNIHVIVVAHPKKMGQEMARKESVSGSKNLTNLADNVIVVSRQGIDFRKRLVGFMGEAKAQEYDGFDTILELSKSRMSGAQDRFFGLFYEAESRRIKNTRAEHINYGWIENPTPVPMFPSGDDSTVPYDPYAPTDPNEEVPF